MVLDFYEDPGHGWLAVPLALLERLALLDKVSSYSYMRGRFAHLEEDCDYSLFALAMRDAGLSFTVRQRRTVNRSRIRGYQAFSAARARAQLSGTGT